MALLWMEGFDQYPNGNLPQGRWDYMAAPTVATATRSAKMVQLGSSKWSDAVIGDNLTTFIIGFALNMNTSQIDRTFLNLLDANNNIHLYLRTTTGGFTVRENGGGILLTATAATFTWVYVELKITIHDASGSIECRINGAANASVGGVDTRNNSGLSGVSRVRLGNVGSATNYSFYFDDLYVLDTTGSVNNDFLGDCKVSILLPDGDSAVQMSRSAGATNASQVNVVGNGDASYVYTSTSGHKDTYTVADTATTALVYGVAATPEIRASDVGLRSFRTHLATGGNAWSKDSIAADNYLHVGQVISDAVSGTTRWNAAAINAALIGVEAL